MKQNVGNACGAVALMHTVMNNLKRISGAKVCIHSTLPNKGRILRI